MSSNIFTLQNSIILNYESVRESVVSFHGLSICCMTNIGYNVEYLTDFHLLIGGSLPILNN